MSNKRRLGSWAVLIVVVLLGLLWSQLPLDLTKTSDVNNQQEFVKNDSLQGALPLESDTKNNVASQADMPSAQDRQASMDENEAALTNVARDEKTITQPDVDMPDNIIIDPEELQSLLKVDINYVIEQWRSAWQLGDSEQYLSQYSENFKPSGNLALQEWQQQRRLKVVPSAQVSIELSDFEVAFDESNLNSVVSFQQKYQSNDYSDSTRKELKLVKEDKWRIVSERTID